MQRRFELSERIGFTGDTKKRQKNGQRKTLATKAVNKLYEEKNYEPG